MRPGSRAPAPCLGGRISPVGQGGQQPAGRLLQEPSSCRGRSPGRSPARPGAPASLTPHHPTPPGSCFCLPSSRIHLIQPCQGSARSQWGLLQHPSAHHWSPGLGEQPPPPATTPGNAAMISVITANHQPARSHRGWELRELKPQLLMPRVGSCSGSDPAPGPWSRIPAGLGSVGLLAPREQD